MADKQIYSTFDWAVRDVYGYYFILGRSDDVINVAGHRLGTREIEECISAHPNVSEVAVVGVVDAIKGQVPIAFVVAKNTSSLNSDSALQQFLAEVMQEEDRSIGAVGWQSKVFLVGLLPKTRSGKLLRRAIQAISEGRDAGDLSTMDDPIALQKIKEAVGL